ncbi:hypothetical protein LTR28_005076 [Elasticomyces elasticus]|nr:hypothetical protein LTR28_005076 [Elasticomyces elasticus]
MAQGSTTASFEAIAGGVGIGVNHAPVSAMFHLPPERVETPPTPSSTVPLLSDPDYVDRPALRDKISTKLSTPAARVALVGLGGAGCSVTGLGDARKGRWVMVLDNVDDATFLFAPPSSTEEGRQRRLIDYLPACEHGCILFTTRNRGEARRLVSESQMVDVSPMEQSHAVSLLEKKLGLDEDQNYSRLARELDCLPLAMAQAAAYICQRRPRCSVERYLSILSSSSLRTSLLRRDEQFPDRHGKASSSILLTWQISFEHIARVRPSAADLLSVMSFCDRQTIPEILVRDDGISSDCDKSVQALDRFEDDVTMLRNFSFVSATTDRSSWEMHRLVQDATRLWLEDGNRYEEFRDRFLYRLNQAIPSHPCNEDDEYPSYWDICRLLFPNAQAALGYKPSHTEALSDWASIMYNAARYMRIRGNDAHGVREETLGHGHPDTISGYADLASLSKKQGPLGRAEQLYIAVIERRQATLGPTYINTLSSIADLASEYVDQGRYEEAGQQFIKVSEIMLAKLGRNQFFTLFRISALVSTYRKLGQWKEAEQLTSQAVTGITESIGKDLYYMIDAIRDFELIRRLREKYDAMYSPHLPGETPSTRIGKELLRLHQSLQTQMNKEVCRSRGSGRRSLGSYLEESAAGTYNLDLQEGTPLTKIDEEALPTTSLSADAHEQRGVQNSKKG